MSKFHYFLDTTKPRKFFNLTFGVHVILTIEPGIYFIPELIDLWRSEGRFKDFINYDKVETYKDFSGLRNEEDYLITETGARRLGKKIPLTTDEVEALR